MLRLVAGLLFAAFGVGAVLGSVVAVRLVHRFEPLRLGATAFVALTVPIFALAIELPVPAVMVALATSSFFSPLVNAPLIGVITTQTPEALRAVQASGILRTLVSNRPRLDQPYQTMQLAQFNYFRDRGLVALDPDGRLEIRYERYREAVKAMLAEALALQQKGDPETAEAFFKKWTTWTDALHEPLGARMAAAEGPRFRLMRYAAIGD